MGAEGTVEIESEWTALRRKAERGLAGEQLRIPPLRQKKSQGWGTHIAAERRAGHPAYRGSCGSPPYIHLYLQQAERTFRQ
jgi:hypothetical protein